MFIIASFQFNKYELKNNYTIIESNELIPFGNNIKESNKEINEFLISINNINNENIKKINSWN